MVSEKTPYAVLDVPARPARDVTILDSTTGRVLPVCRRLDPLDQSSVVAHRHCTSKNAWNPSQQVRRHRAPATCGPSLPACPCTPHASLYGIRCLAHETLVQMLGTALTIPSVSPSGNQRSTDLSVRFGLARLSAFALQGIPCACPATSLTMAEWQSRDTR
jgi:hypothetical protein